MQKLYLQICGEKPTLCLRVNLRVDSSLILNSESLGGGVKCLSTRQQVPDLKYSHTVDYYTVEKTSELQ